MANTQLKSGYFKIAFIILLLCLVFHVVGFVTPSWSFYSGGYIDARAGLWKACIDDNCYNVKGSDDNNILAVQALESLGLACLTLATLTTFVLLCCTANVCLEGLKLVFTLSAGVAIDAGVIWHMVHFGVDYIGYSIMLCSAAGTGCIVAFIILCCCDKAPSTEGQQGYVIQPGPPPNEGQQCYVLQPGEPPSGQYSPQEGYAQQPPVGQQPHAGYNGQQPVGYNVQQQTLYPQLQPYQQQVNPSAPPPTYNQLEKREGI